MRKNFRRVGPVNTGADAACMGCLKVFSSIENEFDLILVTPYVSAATRFAGLLQDRLLSFLDLSGEAILLMDEKRILVWANRAAYQLLGLENGEELGGRCHEMTHGLDCSASCPLNFSLKTGREVVEDFPTIYHRSDGTPLELTVTILTVSHENGDFAGAVEILRPRKTDLGFYLSGNSPAVRQARKEILGIDPSEDLLIVGEKAICGNLALALHRLSGRVEEYFFLENEDDGKVWPPRTVYGENPEFLGILGEEHPLSLRRIGGVRAGNVPDLPDSVGIIRLPSLKEMREDLSTIIGSWFHHLAPEKEISSGALDALVRIGQARGLDAVGAALESGLERAGERLEEKDLDCGETRDLCLLEFLEADDPLFALERRVLREVLDLTGWKIQEAADRLGMSRVTLWRKMKEHKIEKSRENNAGAVL